MSARIQASEWLFFVLLAIVEMGVIKSNFALNEPFFVTPQIAYVKIKMSLPSMVYISTSVTLISQVTQAINPMSPWASLVDLLPDK